MTPLCRYHAEPDCARCARLLVGEILQYHFYVVALIRSPRTKQTKLLAPPDPRQYLQYNIRYTRSQVIESWPSEGKAGYTVELVRLDEQFYQVCEVRDSEPALYYHGSYPNKAEAQSIAQDVAMGTVIDDFHRWIARKIGRLTPDAPRL